MATSAKEAARQIIEHLPEQASWDDIMYELYVKPLLSHKILRAGDQTLTAWAVRKSTADGDMKFGYSLRHSGKCEALVRNPGSIRSHWIPGLRPE